VGRLTRVAETLSSGPYAWARSLEALRGRVGWGEFVTLAALLVCAGGLYAFIEIVNETLEGDAHEFDRALLLALRSAADPADPIGPHWLDTSMRDLTTLGGYGVIVTIAALAVGYLAILRNWGTILLVVASLAGGTLLNNVLKGAFDRPRPELVAHLVAVETASLPSGHAMMSAVAYLTLGALLARVQPWWPLKMYIIGAAVVLTLLVGFSRVYLGVHWPTDVLAGWCLGAAWAMGCWLVARFAMR
jgi:undecaprenyl-diphosphatase